MVYNYDYTSTSTCNQGLLGPSLAEFCNATAYVAFATLLDAFLRDVEKISGICDRIQPIEEPDDVYDFVVIGGGAGGSVMASRLSENPDWKVLLLEAGPDESVAGQVPLIFLTLLGSRLDWIYTTTNESFACLATNGSCFIVTGRMLGGGTSHNAMRYVRGNPSDYDGWAALGNEGWSYEDVLPYFKKAEDNQEIDRVGRKYHATGGPLSVKRFRYLPKFGQSMLAAAIEAGYNVSEDLNGEVNNGFSIGQGTTKNGVRCSSATAYLRPVKNRKNLHISLNSTATRLIIKNGVAVGVKYYKNGKFKTVKVRKEVILSAGTIESPKLLLLSGIGPKKHLKSVGVKVVHDLPGVGENFQDHISYFIHLTINETDTYEWDWAAAAEYLAFQSGPLSGLGTVPVMGQLATNLTTPDSPDIRIGFGAWMATCVPGEVGALRSSGGRAIELYMVSLRPNSRGRVSLASKNPLAHPVIWGNYLSDPSDVERLVQAVEMSLAWTKTKTMRAYGMTMTSTPTKACSHHKFASSKYWACDIRQNAISDNQHAGTCKMGPSTDPMAVVDSKLRLHGIEGLRVVDGSIMPQVTSGNTGAPIMMIGERGADFVKSDWKQDSRRKSGNRKDYRSL